MVSLRYPLLALPVAALAIGVVSSPIWAQSTTSRPVVQRLAPKEVEELQSALRALDRRPRDVDALLNAGYASIKVNDFEAALGYFGRAEEVAPKDARIKQAQATAYLRSGRPVEALRLFEQADAIGTPDRTMLSDRGLAHDLVGDQVRAQAYYREALRDRPSDSETIRRMAVSQAIAGNQNAFSDTLRPLVDQKDFAAFRAQAFGLAILGEQDRAKAVTEAVMPSDLARRIVPYLGYMPRLTKAQQAAAANLGIFPKAADIGREDPRIAAYAEGATAPASTSLASRADNRLEPAGQPLGQQTQPARREVAQAVTTPAPKPTPPPSPAPAIAQAISVPKTATPGFDFGSTTRATDAGANGAVQVTRAGPALPPPANQSLPASAQPAPQPEPSFADVFADMGRADTRNVAKAADAVDISSIVIPREAPPKPAPAPAPKPKAPEHPQRFWVQLGTGQDASLFKYDWTRMTSKASDELGKLSGHFVPFGESFILLAGPLPNKAAMDDLVAKLKEKGLGVLPYRSSEGQEVQKLK